MSSNFIEWVSAYQITQMPIIHVGAHYAEERDDYRDLNFEPVFWIEALPDVAKICLANLGNYKYQHLISAAVSDIHGQEVIFYVAGAEDSSSSILKPHLIEASHPEVTLTREVLVTTTTLDHLFTDNKIGNFQNYGLVLDLQGAEIKAIKGATTFLQNVSFIIAEVSTRSLYKGGAKFKDLTALLDKSGFILYASELNRATGWGEALFINRTGKFSNILNSDTKNEVVVGNYSIGTVFRSILVKIGAPHWLINQSKRR
jgi:FkbM family methyltransferase